MKITNYMLDISLLDRSLINSIRGYKMFKWIIIFIFLSPVFATEPDFGKFDGTGIVLDLNNSEKIVFGHRTDERLSPCSTFKILNSLMALESKVVQDENETLSWDGVVREYPFWNKDHSMRSAIKVSTVWFYQEMARRIGSRRMQQMVQEAHYGNTDTSQSLTDFWLGNGSLQISANEQIDFLSKLLRNQLAFSKHSIATVKDIMNIERKQEYTLSGKTGSCAGVGWFVGFLVEDNVTKVFAFNIKGAGASGSKIKKIVIEYLK